MDKVNETIVNIFQKYWILNELMHPSLRAIEFPYLHLVVGSRNGQEKPMCMNNGRLMIYLCKSVQSVTF